MARDPLLLTKTDIRAIVDVFRKQRHTFQTIGKLPPKPKPEKPIMGKDLLSDL